MEKGKTQARYGLAVFFILCGLTIGILGGCFCLARHYVGVIPLDSTRATELITMYPDGLNSVDSPLGPAAPIVLIPVGPTLHYDILTIRNIEGLPYEIRSDLWWLPICVGLIYVGLGVKSVLSKDWLFVKSKEGHD